jgi:hypothetical protein
MEQSKTVRAAAQIVFAALALFQGCSSTLKENPPPQVIDVAGTATPAPVTADTILVSAPDTLPETRSIVTLIEESENAYNESMVMYELGDLEASRALHEEAFSLLLEAKWQSIKDPVSYEILKVAIDELYAKISPKFRELSQLGREEPWLSSNGDGDSLGGDGVVRGFEMPVNGESELVRKYLEFFSEGGGREFLQASLGRAGKYKEMILEELAKKGLPRELWVVPVIESGYKITANSNKGAVGLWQFMPTTARHHGLVVNEWLDERRDPLKSTRAALSFLEELYLWFNSWELALAAYNRGANNISSDIHNSKMVDFFSIAENDMTHKQTKNFVPQIHAAILIAENPEKYGINVVYEPPPSCDIVTVDYVVDLEVVAKCVGVTEENIKELNPELRTWVTPVLSKDYPQYDLKLPSGTRDGYLSEIAKVTDKTPDRRVRYIVKRGDTLGGIAAKFRVSWKDIQTQNRIKGTLIHPGQSLYIKPGKGWHKTT